jgi:isopenicillin-N N-acyltransferase-like protein
VTVLRQFTSTVAGPLERGLEFGGVHSGEIATTIAAYRRLFAVYQVPVDLDGWGARSLSRIEAWAPDLAEEIRGMAEGSGVPVQHIAAVNARTEILAILRATAIADYGALPWRLTAPDECSSVVAIGAADPFAVQNWDWYAAMADNWLEWTIPHPDGRRVATLTEYGMVGKIGMNDRGVGVLLNMLRHAEDGGDIGVPVHVVSRRILDTATDVPGGLAICGSAAVSASTSLTLASARSAVSVELWPSGPGHVLPAEDGLLLRTNHFLTDAARPGDTTPGTESDTLDRYGELHDQLADRGRELTAAAVIDLLGSHEGSLCCHPEPDDIVELQHATLANVRLDLAARTLATHAGTPCLLAART